MATSFFDEKSGIVPCNTEWGRWWQTVDELHIEIKLPTNTKAKDVKVNVTNSSIACQFLGKTLFSVSLILQPMFIITYYYYFTSYIFILLNLNYILQSSMYNRVNYSEKYMAMKLYGH